MTGWDAETVRQIAALLPAPEEEPAAGGTVRILPYPGGRHPRAGFLDGAIDPHRGTKASIFPPWGGGYAVLDIPEAIFERGELIYLAHTHIPTVWDRQNVVLENVDWSRTDDGLNFRRVLPNNVAFGVALRAGGRTVDLDLWIENGSEAALTDLRAQVCLMLKALKGFDAQHNDNKVFEPPVTVVRDASGNRAILLAFQQVGRSWGNTRCPCAHADPVFPDAAPGERHVARGRIWFHEGNDLDAAVAAAREWAAAR